MLPAFKLKTEQLKEYQSIIFPTLSEVVENYYKLQKDEIRFLPKTKTIEQSKALYSFIIIASKLTFSSYVTADYLGISYHLCYLRYSCDRLKSFAKSKETIFEDYNEIVKIFSNKLKQVYGTRVF